MKAFATTEALAKRWRELSDVEKERAEALLMDASVIILTLCAKHGVEIDGEDELQVQNLERIACEMVKRAMLAPVDQAPMSQFSQTAGSYSESGTFVNPTGDLYITASERKSLGIGRQRLFSIRPTGGEPHEG